MLLYLPSSYQIKRYSLGIADDGGARSLYSDR